MFLKRRIEEQTHEPDVGLMLVQRVERDVIKHRVVVLLFYSPLESLILFPRKTAYAFLAALVFEDRHVQGLFVLKVPEHHRLGNVARTGDLLCRRTLKT